MNNGKIITLTSYRGGTGRTMAVANLAWMLASSGKHVLAVDWNLFTPGLAEFFYPFFDPEHDLRLKPGVIDLLWEHILEVYRPNGSTSGTFDLENSMNEKIGKINWKFNNNGSLGILNAGYFDTYRTRIQLFPYGNFLNELQGTDFIERFRNHLLKKYDYVIIDGPPILNDIGGICSIQLADALGICFTPFGNEALGIVEALRRIKHGRNLLINERLNQAIVPIIMRTERSEMGLHKQVKDEIKKSFRSFETYLGDLDLDLEVPQFPYYMYRRAHTYFSENKNSSGLNKVYEQILKRLTGNKEFISSWPSEEESNLVMKQYDVPCSPLLNWSAQFYENSENLRPTEKTNLHFFISYKRNDFIRIAHVIAQIQSMGFDIWWDLGLHGGVVWKEVLQHKIETSSALILFITEKSNESTYIKEEIKIANDAGKPILPIVIDPIDPKSEFQKFTNIHYIYNPGTVPSKILEITLRKLCTEP